jgi:hypothetical protein
MPRSGRLQIIAEAARISSGERRTKRALFFTVASLLVGFTVAGWPGVLVCGAFGGSLYLVVLVLRMQRHLRASAERGLPPPDRTLE